MRQVTHDIMRQELLILLKKYAYKKGSFTLSSGKHSEHYVNCKPVTLNGEGINVVSNMLLECIEPDVKAVAGLTMGADPLVTGVAMTAYLSVSSPDLEALIVRKKPKGYGTNKWVEGNLPPKGSKITVLEDVVTTANSSIQAVVRLRELGYVVDRIITIVDRQDGREAYNNCESANVDLISLYQLNELF